MANLLWLQGQCCSGNTMSILGAEEPNILDLLSEYGVNLAWHPSLSLEMGDQVKEILDRFVHGEDTLDVLVIEGAIATGPDGTGAYNMFCRRPFKDWVWSLAGVAQFVVAVGDCACWGGIPAADPNPTGATGVQFLKKERGGFLGEAYRSQAGLPVINVPGCPAHPDWMTQTLLAVLVGRAGDLVLDEFQRPADLFATLTHHGCTRNEYFEYKVAADFGQKEGCLFVDLGCRGPLTHSPCNRILWNRQSSKTRAGVPCFGCTEPDFPTFDFFTTKKHLGIPDALPLDVPRARYVALAGVAKSACPSRLKRKQIEGRG